MTNLVPGFRWEPVDVGNRAQRRKGRGLVGHVYVSNRDNERPGPVATRNADWHFYLPKVGVGIQQIDLDLQSWSSFNGNADTASFESQGGVGNAAAVNSEPWSADQIESAAQILAHMHRTEGVPLQVMPNSLPGSRGFGYHRLGIDPWRVSGGQKWSTSRGKLCPGDAKIAQAPQIVARAAELVGGSPVQEPAPAAPSSDTPPVMGWPFPRNHYVGDIKGPAASHGGYYPGERAFVQNVQQWLIYAGCVPGVSDWRSGWADGKFEAPYSTNAAVAFHNIYYGGQPYPAQMWSDDYAVLIKVRH